MAASSRNFIVTAAVAWAFIGAVGYGDPALFDGDDGRGGVALLLSVFIFVCLVFSPIDEALAGRYYAPVITAFGCTTVLSCVAAGWENEQRRLFWCQSGIFAGFLVEKATGLYERHVWRPSLKEQAAADARRKETVGRPLPPPGPASAKTRE